MLKINKVEYGLVSTGPALGLSAFSIHFSEVEGEYVLDDYDNGKKWEFDKQTRVTMEHPRELYTDLFNKVKENNLEKEFLSALDGTQQCLLFFIGGEIDNPKNFKEFNRLSLDLSTKTWNYQISLGVPFEKLKPPYSVYLGTPKYMSGKQQFYELFNSVYAIINDDKFNSLAFQECLNNVFSLAVFTSGDIQQISSIKDKFKIPNYKTCICSHVARISPTLLGDVLRLHYRFYPIMDEKPFLKLI